eukprot:jgi/Botrbrau1/239/Bobra.0022s0214.2
MHTFKEHGRKPVKQVINNYQQRRRLQALERQKFARKDALNKARNFFVELSSENDEYSAQEQVEGLATTAGHGQLETAGETGHAGHVQGRRRYYRAVRPAKARNPFEDQLMEPEWLIDIPPNLAESWLVMARPEGERCLVTAARGWVTAHSKRGKLRQKFQSSLPGGSGELVSEIASVLDCVFSAGESTFYVLDMLYWKGQALCDCPAELRLFLVASRLEEAGFSFETQGLHDFSFVPLPCFPCTPEGLQTAYESPLPFQRDGLLLLHKEGCYETGGVSPLALRWTDSHCSRYPITTNPAGVVQAHQQVILEYRMDRTVGTGDSEPVVLGRLPDAFVAGLGKKLR